MIDYTLTFDHWWYFYHRLQAGELAQWNPFSLLGRIAVQWNYIPASIFSPLMVLSELTPENFKAFTIAGTFLVLLSVYASGRIAGYGRYLPLLPVVLIAASGFRYWISFLHFSTFLTVFPVAIGYLVSIVNRGTGFRFREYTALAVLLATAFLGLRLELMMYSLSFVILLFLVLACFEARDGTRLFSYVLAGLGLAAFAAAASAWQLAFLVTSTLENHRVTLGVNLSKLTDPHFLKWLLASVAFQPAFLLLLINLGLWVICRLIPRLSVKHVSNTPVSLLLAFELLVVIGLKHAVGMKTSSLQRYLGMEADALQRNFDVFFSVGGVVAMVLAVLVFVRSESKPTLERSFLFLAVLFSGFQIATYTGHTWPVNRNVHPYFVPISLTGLLPLGAVGLWLKQRTWVVAVLVVYHAVGEIGAFILLEVFGISWFPSRAAFAEMPLQLILMMEAFLFLIRGPIVLLGGVATRLVRPRLSTSTTLAAHISCLVVMAFAVEWSLFPKGLVMNLDAFPFGGPVHEISLPNGSLEQWVNTPEGIRVPTNCSFRAGGIDARLEKLSGAGRAADGEAAACILPISTGDSWLRYSVPDLKPVKGRYVRFMFSVKTANTNPGGIQVDAQDGVSPIVFAREEQGTTGTQKWQRRSLVTHVHPKARMLLLTINATQLANASVCVDDLRLEVAERPPQGRWVYLEDFPFAWTNLGTSSRPTNAWIQEALRSSEGLRNVGNDQRDPLRRKKVSDDILMFTAFQQYYKFLPAYSQTLNTAPLYSSEIPRTLKNIFSDTPGVKDTQSASLMLHAEMGLVLRAYKWSILHARNQQLAKLYPALVTVLPHQARNPVFKEVLAEEGGSTPRAFLSGQVVRLTDTVEEFNYLSGILAGGGKLSDQITTSDSSLPPSGLAVAGIVSGKVSFVRDNPEHIILEVSADRDAYLALLDLWSPGWRAKLDGQETPIYRGYMATRFIALSAGRHTVEFTYRVPGLIIASWISMVAWTTGVVTLLTTLRRA